ncbi:nucleotidyl transferase AbiEii/AbiGii toxin family protein [Virgibacillus sp. CBA3643]|uniref:nucleotidyl transferase AbiEii/AbiGii toxin family protein n=1 Tax=Virgibacillus sp. CBA3643 TaxID=2942278 RepID=UPI0035A307C9
MADAAASTLAKLKNKARQQGIQLQQLLNLFCQEEFIRRLSRSKYKDKLILKGGFLLYTISEFTTRPTIDADYLLKNYPNDLSSLETLINDIISVPGDYDFIRIEVRNTETISEVKEYHGIRVNLMGLVGNTKTPFSVDFGVGDVIVPSPVPRTLPVLLPGFEKSEVLTYSLESTIAEKIDAIISLMDLTSRMKDFYDIYYLAATFNFEGRKLQEAIYETLSNRGTPYESDSIKIIERLVQNEDIQKRWSIFCKKILKFELDLDSIIHRIIEFLQPPFEAIVHENEFFGVWDSEESKYIK